MHHSTLNRPLAKWIAASICAVFCFAPPTRPAFGQEAPRETAPTMLSPETTIDVNIPIEQLKVLIKPLTKTELEVEADAWMELLRHKARQVSAARLGVQKTNQALKAEKADEVEAVLETADSLQENAASAAEAKERALMESAREKSGWKPPAAGESAADGKEAKAGDETATVAKAEDAAAPLKQDATASPGEALQAVASEKKVELLDKVTELQRERTAIADRLEVVLASLEQKGGEVTSHRAYSKAVEGIEIDASDASATWAALSGWLKSEEGGRRWMWNLVQFVVTLGVTIILARLIASVVNWLLERKVKLSILAEKLISGSIRNVLYLIGFAIALTALEIDITPILAAMGAAGLVIGLALQGTLSNFASGLMILINRPFDEGDVVTAGGVTGTVNKMNIVSTAFRTFDNQTIHVPNNEVWNNVITNITANDKRRVDLEFGIGYDDDFEEAERIIQSVVDQHPLVLADPPPVIVTHELADSSINIVCRPWAKTSDWWTIKTDVTRAVKKRFDEAGISIPFPQRDVHIYQHTATNSDTPTP